MSFSLLLLLQASLFAISYFGLAIASLTPWYRPESSNTGVLPAGISHDNGLFFNTPGVLKDDANKKLKFSKIALPTCQIIL